MPIREKKRPFPFFLVAAALLLLAGLGMLIFTFSQAKQPSRIAIALVGPTRTSVLSYDPYERNAALVSIPSETVVDAVRGYGAYSLSSLFKLDRMEKRNGVLFLETLEETLGIPVRFFLTVPQDISLEEGRTIQSMNEAFSIFHIVKVVFRQVATNLPFRLIYKVFRAVQALDPKHIVVFDLREPLFQVSELEADGTVVKKLDLARVSLTFGTNIEDARIRREGYRTTVYNTTTVPSLAQGASRMLETIGVHVVLVGNTEGNEVGTCKILGAKELEKTLTVKAIGWIFGCVYEEGQTDASDYKILLGTSYAKRFLPFTK
jgi:hypothetical protein